jgi:hypothetical protein
MKISPTYTVDDWRAAFQDEPDWERAIDIVKDRIEGRFIRWIDLLLPNEFSGFAIIALDCLLLETLYGFLNGESTRDTKRAYCTILMKPPFSFDEDLARSFYENVRNGIVHDTETRKGWLIRITRRTRIVERDASGTWILDRTKFHTALKVAFENWIGELQAGIRCSGKICGAVWIKSFKSTIPSCAVMRIEKAGQASVSNRFKKV